jgi:XTP/dITP diphosphohydrolase
MNMKKKVILATTNAGKQREFQALLENCNVELVTNRDFNLAAPEETGATFIENALIKARFASSATALPAIADDSGLVVDSLQGLPGVHSARYAGVDATSEQRNQKLLQALSQTAERSAYYVCVLVYLATAEDPCPLIAQATWHGRIVDEPRGSGGFGYDPIFYIDSHQCTVAELPLEIKNRISHRGLAMSQLLNQLQQKWQP